MKRASYRLFATFLFTSYFILLPPLLNATDYQYYYGDKTVVLHSSPHLIIINSDKQEKKLNEKNLQKIGVILDPLSKNPTLMNKGLKLYRRTQTEESLTEPSLKVLIEKNFSSVVSQPVFEQGQALLIPSDEIIVGFDTTGANNPEWELPTETSKSQGIIKIEILGNSRALVSINKPGDGRCYEVCRELVKIPRVSFAEPNHLLIMLDDQENSASFNETKIATNPETLNLLSPPTANALDPPPSDLHFEDSGGQLQEKGWQIINGLDAESESYPPAGWKLSNGPGKTKASWGPTEHRAFTGRHSLYCAAYGPAAVRAPGPVPLHMAGYLYSPPLDLENFAEVYIELWFYSKNEIAINNLGKPELRDLPVIGITDGQSSSEKLLAVIHSDGDCTIDPTAKNGWRKCLFKIPQIYHKENVRFCFLYLSNGQNPKEGCYIDDIRILGRKARQESSALGNDPYCIEQYELLNRGQIAGMGNQNNDMDVGNAWDLVTVDPNLVVAVIDDGVELEHPDLNLTPGFQPDGSAGGGPPTEKSNHGTSVAGNIGAIGNNGIGVIGVAPNIKIMSINGGNDFLERAQAIRLAVRKGAKIINNSWGWVGPPSREIEAAVQEALTAGVVVLFAAGNGPDRPPFTYDVAFPGKMTETSDVICVGASSPSDEHKAAASSDGQFSWGSSYIGPGPDICAPGPWSYTTDRLGKLGYNDGSSGVDADYCHDFGGTSSSCPKVAGVVALMLSKNPQLTPAEVKDILRKSADDIDVPGYDDKTGAGRVNAYKAVQMAQTKEATTHQNPSSHNSSPYDAFDTPDQSNERNQYPPTSPQKSWQSVIE